MKLKTIILSSILLVNQLSAQLDVNAGIWSLEKINRDSKDLAEGRLSAKINKIYELSTLKETSTNKKNEKLESFIFNKKVESSNSLEAKASNRIYKYIEKQKKASRSTRSLWNASKIMACTVILLPVALITGILSGPDLPKAPGRFDLPAKIKDIYNLITGENISKNENIVKLSNEEFRVFCHKELDKVIEFLETIKA